ncbi:MAG TPA: hypothetical protein VG826_17775 [Pirellulales bacterium]|nr:hypothetical protein [Pirellulales bacterium]
MLRHPCGGLSFLGLSAVLIALSGVTARADGEKLPSPGINAPLNGWRPMSAESEWNRPIDDEPVDPNSRQLLAAIRHASGQFAGHAWLHPDFGRDGGIPYVVVDRPPATRVSFEYADESDKGEYAVPLDAPVEPGSDRHVLVVDRGRNKLFELFAARLEGQGWRAGSGAIFDLAGDDRQRPDGWTSADAAGLPIFPGLAKYDEVASGEIKHALRFTAPKTRKAYVFPASHYASPHTDAGLPPMGMRIRLKKSFDTRPFAPAARTILKCLQTYGGILADNGGPFFVSGAPHPEWDTEDLAQIKRIRDEVLLDSLEVVRIDPKRLTVGR